MKQYYWGFILLIFCMARRIFRYPKNKKISYGHVVLETNLTKQLFRSVPSVTSNKKLQNCQNVNLGLEKERKIDDMASQLMAQSNITHYVMFLGFARSGHSFIGSVIDAAPNALIANEHNAFDRFLNSEYNTSFGLFQDLAINSIRCGLYGRVQVYNYTIPNSWQGHANVLTIIGDKKGGTTTQLLRKHPRAFDNFLTWIGTQVYIVVVFRNPFDMIATQTYRSHSDKIISDANILKVLNLYSFILDYIEQHPNIKFHVMTMENFAEKTDLEFNRLCKFTGMECNGDLFRQVNKTVHHKVHKRRYEMKWLSEQKQKVETFIQKNLLTYYDSEF